MFVSIEDQVEYSDFTWPNEAVWMQYSDVRLRDGTETVAIEYFDWSGELTIQIPAEDLGYIQRMLSDVWLGSRPDIPAFLETYAHIARLEYGRQIERRAAAE